MFDLITNMVLGDYILRHNNTPSIKPIDTIQYEKEEIGYVILNDVYDLPTTIQGGYNDYDRNIITIVRDGHIFYYLEIYAPLSKKLYGNKKILRNI